MKKPVHIFLIFGALLSEENKATSLLKRRMLGAIEHSKHSGCFLFIVTGKGARSIPEAHIMRDFLLDHGIPPDRILMEDQAKDTLQSIYFCRPLITKIEGPYRLYICTSPFHQIRCQLLMKLSGFPCVAPPMPGDLNSTSPFKYLRYCLHELIATPFDAAILLLERAGLLKPPKTIVK